MMIRVAVWVLAGAVMVCAGLVFLKMMGLDLHLSWGAHQRIF